jgi:hypothetical protein
MAKSNKKAYLVDVSFRVRVVVGEDVDPNTDVDFDRAVFQKLREIMAEGVSGIADNIEDFNEDEECPYDPETD